MLRCRQSRCLGSLAGKRIGLKQAGGLPLEPRREPEQAHQSLDDLHRDVLIATDKRIDASTTKAVRLWAASTGGSSGQEFAHLEKS